MLVRVSGRMGAIVRVACVLPMAWSVTVLAGCPAPSSSTSSSTTSLVETLTLTPYFCVFFDAFDMMTDLPGLRVPPGLSGALRYIAIGVQVFVWYVVHIMTLCPARLPGCRFPPVPRSNNIQSLAC